MADKNPEYDFTEIEKRWQKNGTKTKRSTP